MYEEEDEDRPKLLRLWMSRPAHLQAASEHPNPTAGDFLLHKFAKATAATGRSHEEWMRSNPIHSQFASVFASPAQPLHPQQMPPHMPPHVPPHMAPHMTPNMPPPMPLPLSPNILSPVYLARIETQAMPSRIASGPTYDPDNPRKGRNDWREEYSTFYYASLCGLRSCAQELLREGADVKSGGGTYGNALQAA